MSVEPQRPNILFIMADQYRHDYLGCAGAGFVRTPNLDRIAERGVRQLVQQDSAAAPGAEPTATQLA